LKLLKKVPFEEKEVRLEEKNQGRSPYGLLRVIPIRKWVQGLFSVVLVAWWRGLGC
jgi:hypothetical protein